MMDPLGPTTVSQATIPKTTTAATPAIAPITAPIVPKVMHRNMDGSRVGGVALGWTLQTG